mmetsp:Transcript_1088/g.3383  ORF Transcript_1088/g.3383 Transcript_1088/m.3383 type:complete len:309 (+) Transcript_1088:300-1226(+)
MMDTSVVELKNPLGYSLVTTTDFFFPLVEDPYLMGRIACANVLSDMYAEGVVQCDNMLMILAASLEIPADYRDIIVWKMIEGFRSLAEEAGSAVTGGQSVYNPWPIIGGVAQAVVPSGEVQMPVNAEIGDAILLTKPLGTQVAVNTFQWIEQSSMWEKVEQVITVEHAKWAYDIAALSMERLNKTASSLMKKHQAHAATDVTGFGIIGHAQNLAGNQRHNVSFKIESLPVIKGLDQVDKAVGGTFKLLAGKSAETSGGLLICLRPDNIKSFCDELMAVDGWPAFRVGTVVSGNRTAFLSDNLVVEQVE